MQWSDRRTHSWHRKWTCWTFLQTFAQGICWRCSSSYLTKYVMIKCDHCSSSSMICSYWFYGWFQRSEELSDTLEKHQFFTWLRRLSGLAVWAFSPLTMSNRSLSAPDFVTSNTRRMQLRHFWEVCHEFLLSTLPVLTSKLRLMKALMEPDFWLLTHEWGYICMPSWLTVTCVFVLESLLEEPAGFAMVPRCTKARDLEAKWRGHKGTMNWTMYVAKQSAYHTVSLRMCLCYSWFQDIFSEVLHFISMFSASMLSINRTDPVRSKAINAEIFANDTWVWGSSLSASSASCNFSCFFCSLTRVFHARFLEVDPAQQPELAHLFRSVQCDSTCLLNTKRRRWRRRRRRWRRWWWWWWIWRWMVRDIWHSYTDYTVVFVWCSKTYHHWLVMICVNTWPFKRRGQEILFDRPSEQEQAEAEMRRLRSKQEPQVPSCNGKHAKSAEGWRRQRQLYPLSGWAISHDQAACGRRSKEVSLLLESV